MRSPERQWQSEKRQSGWGWGRGRMLRGFGATRKDWTKAGKEVSEKGTQLPGTKGNVNLKHHGQCGQRTSDREGVQESCGLPFFCNSEGRGARQKEPFVLRSQDIQALRSHLKAFKRQLWKDHPDHRVEDGLEQDWEQGGQLGGYHGS